MENNNKSQAEIYREERKARLEKAAAKKSKKKHTFSKQKRVITKAISTILAIAIALLAVFAVFNFFGTPQRVIKVKVANDKDISFSLAEFNYYYYFIWQQIENTAYQYDYQYGNGLGAQLTGYDFTKAPDSQEYKDEYSGFTGISLEDLNVENATWADVMKYAAICQIVQTKYGAKLAKEAGLSITPEQQAKIDERIQDIADDAKEADFSTDRYLRKAYGNGINEDVFRQILADQTLADTYFDKFATDSENGITEQQINDKFNENPADYSIVSLRTYRFTASYDTNADDAAKDTARKQAEALANAFLASANSEENFIKLAGAELKKNDKTKDSDPDKVTALNDADKSTVISKADEATATWAFSSERAVGDKSIFKVDDGDAYVVVMITTLAHKDTTSSGNDVRHILIKFPDAQKDADGKTIALTEAQKATAKAKAEEVLAKYNENPTEENFIALTKEFTADVDSSGNPNNDGLYEGITAGSNYVEAFLNWSIDNSRKPGDTGIVETEYGYHVMYYVKSQGQVWSTNIKNEILSEISENLIEKIDNELIATVKMDDIFLKWAYKKQTKHIKESLLRMIGS